MKRWAKRILIAAGIAAAVIGIACLALMGLGRLIYAQRTCEWVNIDNIELHTGINIPRIADDDCTYFKAANAKVAYFRIDKERVPIADYVRINRFVPCQPGALPVPDALLGESTAPALPPLQRLHYTTGTRKGETWQALLDTATGGLWVVLRYHD